MAARAQKLDRKARRAIAIAVALLFAGPVILVAKYVITQLADRQEVIQSDDDQLVMLPDGSTMLARHGSTARIMANWLEADSGGAKAFDIGNENFAPQSATFTNDGWEHLAQFSQMLRAHHGVDAVVLYSAHHGISASLDLEHSRADRIREEALKQGVDQEQIKVSKEAYEAGHNTAGDEGLEIVLTNKA